MALRIIDHGSPEYQQMLRLRMDLLRAPLGLSFDEEDLEQEKKDWLVAAFEDQEITGCCVLTSLDEQRMRLRQMAVPKNLQAKGIGRSLIQFAEALARDHGYRLMILHARKTAMGFYAKMGYIATGSEFTEVGIPHYAMEKKL
jgi:predicted GNAT family N-acyltransferase